MPTYSINYYTAEGDYKRRNVDADTPEAAQAVLRAEGLHPVAVKQSARSDRRRFSTKLTTRELIDVFEHFELQFTSSVTAIDAITSLKDSSPSARTRTVMREIYNNVVNGRMELSAAFALFPKSFSAATVAMIKAGEGGGTEKLGENFADIRERLEHDEAVRSSLRQGISYPALLLFFSVLLIALMLTLFVPKVSALLKELDAKLPDLTLAVIAAGEFCQRHWMFILGSIFAIPVVIRLIRLTPKGAELLDSLFLKLPFFGQIYTYLAVATIAKYYRSLKRAGKTPGETLKLCEQLFENIALRAEIAAIGHNVTVRSMPLSRAFSLAWFFPPQAVVLIQTGEKAGNLEECLRRISAYYQRRARDRITQALFWLTPAVTIGLGVIVGTVLIALFMPLFSAIASVNL